MRRRREPTKLADPVIKDLVLAEVPGEVGEVGHLNQNRFHFVLQRQEIREETRQGKATHQCLKAGLSLVLAKQVNCSLQCHFFVDTELIKAGPKGVKVVNYIFGKEFVASSRGGGGISGHGRQGVDREKQPGSHGLIDTGRQWQSISSLKQ